VSLDSHVHLFVPGAADDPRTLVLLHGTGGDEREFGALGELLAPGAARLSVRGNVREHGMNRFFRRLVEAVYDLDDLAVRTAELRRFVDAALAHHGRDPAEAIAVGYSNGANILANLLLVGPSVPPRAVLMHPLIPFEPAPGPDLTGVDVLITAGARDPIGPMGLTDRLAALLRDRGAAVELRVFPGGHALTRPEVDTVHDWLAQAGARGSRMPSS
jgi:predicted esterase